MSANNKNKKQSRKYELDSDGAEGEQNEEEPQQRQRGADNDFADVREKSIYQQASEESDELVPMQNNLKNLDVFINELKPSRRQEGDNTE